MKTRLYQILALGLFALVLPASGLAKLSGSTNFVETLGQYKVGKELPRMILQDSEGNFAFNGNFKYGKQGTVFTFFQTTCGPCLAGMTALTKAAKEFEEAGVNIIAVHVREPKGAGAGDLIPKDVKAWIDSKNLKGFSVLYDPTGSLQNVGIINKDGQVTLPVTVVVGGVKTVVGLAREEGTDYVSGMLSRIKKAK